MNQAWHKEHPLPKRATLDQRIAWHTEHARACGCRPIPESVTNAIAARSQGNR